ncbi:MAG TPA: serine hydrolase [Actinoplanes sp.]|nr:serine hydrolase [Actinoplanes sp.]
MQHQNDSRAEGTPGRARRVARRVLITVPVTLVVLIVVAYLGTAAMKVPPPHTLYRVQTTEPSRWGDVFPARTIDAAVQATPLAAAPRTLPSGVPWKGGQIPVGQFLDTTRTDAFLVLHDGKVGYEWYRDGITAGTRMSSWSMAKSVLSLLVGQAVERGELAEDDRLTDLLPELRTGGDYDRITVRDLLDMASGIDVSENYREWWPFTGTARMYLTRDLPGFLKENRTVSYAPGSRATYRSVDAEVLGLVLHRVTGRNLTDLLTERLWQPMGAERSATWNLDHPGGVEKAYCCINATAREYARIGQLVLDQGRDVVPAAWITRITTPAPHRIEGWGYSALWWHPSGGHDYSAIGIYGQYIYVDPASRTVIVKLSDYGALQDEQDTFEVLRAIARS